MCKGEIKIPFWTILCGIQGSGLPVPIVEDVLVWEVQAVYEGNKAGVLVGSKVKSHTFLPPGDWIWRPGLACSPGALLLFQLHRGAWVPQSCGLKLRLQISLMLTQCTGSA